MTSAASAVRVPGALLCAVLAGALALAAPGVRGQSARVQVNMEIAAGKWKTMRLRNLPAQAQIAVRLQSSGEIDVIFLHQDELSRFPGAVRPDFRARTEARLAFAVRVPKAGHYYLVLDNRRGGELRNVRVLIQAKRAPSPPPKEPAGAQGRT